MPSLHTEASSFPARHACGPRSFESPLTPSQGPEPLPAHGEHTGARLLSTPLPSPALWPFRKPSQLQSPLSRGPCPGAGVWSQESPDGTSPAPASPSQFPPDNVLVLHMPTLLLLNCLWAGPFTDLGGCLCRSWHATFLK